VTGSLLTAVYTGRLVIPPGVPAGAAVQARDGLAGAVEVAGDLPGPSGTELVDAARAAFGAGFAAVGMLGATLLAGAVVLALTALRRPADAR
ncbi:MAG: MFS transporter, partial [Actinomycetota bacterium]|nr:MFS transporter [Actinomycetota bacterium]